MTKQEEYELACEQLETNFSVAWAQLVQMAEESYEKAMEFVADCYYRGKYVEMDEPLV